MRSASANNSSRSASETSFVSSWRAARRCSSATRERNTSTSRAGRTLHEIRRALGKRPSPAVQPPSEAQPQPREIWRRIMLAPGVELHVASGVRLPSTEKMLELARWWGDKGDDHD